jgi:hypothetical protein
MSALSAWLRGRVGSFESGIEMLTNDPLHVLNGVRTVDYYGLRLFSQCSSNTTPIHVVLVPLETQRQGDSIKLSPASNGAGTVEYFDLRFCTGQCNSVDMAPFRLFGGSLETHH